MYTGIYRAMLKNLSDKLRSYSLSGTHKRFFSVIVITLAVTVTLHLFNQARSLYSLANPDAVNIFITPSETTMPPDGLFNLFIDAKSKELVFAKVELVFDQNVVNLLDEITPTGPLSRVINKSTMAEANNLGKISLVVALPPSQIDSPPTGVFEIARFPMTVVTSNTNITVPISIDLDEVQIIDINRNVSAASAQAAVLTINPVAETPTPIPPLSSNLVVNPSFESGTDPWSFSHKDGIGTFTTSPDATDGISSGMATIVTQGSTTQVFQSGLSLEANTRYTLSFDAKSSSGNNVNVAMIQHASPYSNYGLHDSADLTSLWQTFSYSFTTTGFSGSTTDARLRLILNDVDGDVYSFDNFVLTPTAGSPTPTDIPPTPTFTPTPTPPPPTPTPLPPEVQATLYSGYTPVQVTEQWYSVGLPGSYSSVFAGVDTHEGGDPVYPRVVFENNDRFKAKLEEETSRDSETVHVEEGLSYVGANPGILKDTSGRSIGEVVMVPVSQPNEDTWFRQNLQLSYANPVVVAQIVSINDSDPAHIRIKSVTARSFEYQIEEWDYQTPGTHGAETVAFLILESGINTLSDGTRVFVGKSSIDHSFKRIEISSAGFSNRPAVISLSQTLNGIQATVTKHRSVSRASFDVRLIEEERNDQTHLVESVGYVVVGK